MKHRLFSSKNRRLCVDRSLNTPRWTGICHWFEFRFWIIKHLIDCLLHRYDFMFHTKIDQRKRELKRATSAGSSTITISLKWSFIWSSFASIYRAPSLIQLRSPMGWKQVVITSSHLWMVNSSNYEFFATKLSAANCSSACNYQRAFNKYGNTTTCQKVKIRQEKADFKNVWQTNSLINPGTPRWLTSLSVSISGKEVGFYDPSSKVNTFASTARKVLAFASRLWISKGASI